MLTMLFTHLLGILILMSTHGLRRMVLVPPVFLPNVTEFVIPNVTLEELILRQELLQMAIPTLITGQFVMILLLTVVLMLVRTGPTNLPGTILLMILPVNLNFPFVLTGLRWS